MKTTVTTSKIQTIPAGVCPVCGSGLVYPLEHSRTGQYEWQLLLLCPDCFAWRHLVVGGPEHAQIMSRARADRADIRRQLAELEQLHMREECEKFIAALMADRILPMDF